MGKAQRKQTELYASEKEEHARHLFKVQKKEQERKLTKDVDKALRNRDYARLAKLDEY